MAEKESKAEFQALQRAFAGHATESERQRQESYQLFEALGEADVDLRMRAREWLDDPDKRQMHDWAQAWLREQKTKRESMDVVAAGVTADAPASSPKSTKVAPRWAIWASLIALLAIAWIVWRSYPTL